MKNLCFLRVTGKAVDRNYLSIIKRRERWDVFVERVFMAKKLTNDWSFIDGLDLLHFGRKAHATVRRFMKLIIYRGEHSAYG